MSEPYKWNLFKTKYSTSQSFEQKQLKIFRLKSDIVSQYIYILKPMKLR